jgi:hypothetical protein
MEGYNKKRKVATKHDDSPVELTTITLYNNESKDQRQAMGKDVGVQTEPTAVTLDDELANFRRQITVKNADIQTELTAIMLDDEQANYWRYITSDDVEIKSNSPCGLDGLQPNINKEEPLDQSQVTEPVVDSGKPSDTSTTKNSRVVEKTTEEPRLPTTNMARDNREDHGPIVGYAEEPLLPLSKACAPLKNILHNLLFYVHMAMDETPEQPPDGLTIDESAAIRLYTIEWERPHRSLYSLLNHTLKYEDREHLRPYFKYLKLFVTALAKLPCVPPLTVWRGVTKNMSAEFPAGTPVTWWAFSSCTTALTVLENNMYLGTTGNRTLFSVEAINGRTVRAHSHFVTEDEIVLLPGTHMIVQSQFSPAPDLHIIHLRQVIPDQVLLEPPFEGNTLIVNELFQVIIFLYLGAHLYPKTE